MVTAVKYQENAVKFFLKYLIYPYAPISFSFSSSIRCEVDPPSASAAKSIRHPPPLRSPILHPAKLILHPRVPILQRHFFERWKHNPLEIPSLQTDVDRVQAIGIATINCTDLRFKMKARLSNKGRMDGTHVVLVFWEPGKAAKGMVRGMPKTKLVGFEKVAVKSGAAAEVVVELDVCKDLSVVDGDGKSKLVTGENVIVVGASSERQAKHGVNTKVATMADAGYCGVKWV